MRMGTTRRGWEGVRPRGPRALLVGVILAVAGVPAVCAREDPLGLEEIKTAHGLLEISVVESSEGRKTFKLLLAGKLVAEERGLYSVSIAAAHPRDNPRMVLLLLGSGGTGCPAQFKVLEVMPGGEARLSEKFGNCSDLFDTKWQDSAWRIDIPKIGGAAAQSWLYRDIKLTRMKPSSGR